ncbi:MAG: outer membrane protein assembly factor BamA [Desulfovibrio sp.]|jgi:outer membrane protein insertion porin family|nr:outer membrane protein assembly factor BamA [Desulfovibrio sp.]
MSKRVERAIPLLALLTLLCLPALPAGRAQAASSHVDAAQTILVLPFQVTGSEELQEQAAVFTEALTQRLAARGVRVIPNSAMTQLIQSRKVSSLDIAAARSLAAAAKATHAVYGAVHQIGGSVSVDARLVSVDSRQATRPIFVEQAAAAGSILPAVEETASRISGQVARRGGLAGVEVRGTKVLDPDVVLLRINTRKGDIVDSAAIDQEVKRIWDLGYFSDVKVEMEDREDGLYLIYEVTEKPRLESISVEGNQEMDEEDILSAMSNKAGSIFNERMLAEDIAKILEMYRKDGYYLAKVQQRLETRQGGATAALFLTIDEGKRLYIKEVRIEGAEQLSESDVKGELLLSERSIISWITGSGVLNEDLIERDSSAISAYYLDNGFLDISVAAPDIRYDEDGIVLTFPINEGVRYKLGDILLTGDLIDTDERLRSIIELDDLAAEGGYFKLSVMQADSRKLTDFYADYGFAFAEISPRPQKRQGDDAGIVDVAFAIQKRNKVFVRNVVVEGNSKTRDNVILREMRLTDGEPFHGGHLRRSTERLNKLGFFEVAEAELVPTRNEDEVDLKITVKEKPTGALMAGVGYSTFSKVGVAGTLMERNLWGKGYLASLQASFSSRRDAYTFTFTNPRWDDGFLSVGTDLYHWRDDYIDYRKRTTGGVLRFAYPIGEYTSLGWGYRFDQYELYDVDDDASSIIRRYADGVRHSSVALARVIRDTTNREHPTSGNIDRIGFEYGGGLLAGDDDFLSVSVEHQTYFQLWQDHVLHFRARGAAIFKNGSDDIPVFERFWMGGMDSVRGYDSRDIVPRDPKTDDRIGGDRMAFANIEYIYSLSDDVGVNIVPFFDIGFNLDSDQYTSLNDEILKSFGLEMRWRSPMGDLRFSYGIPLDEDRKGNRDAGRFEFSMGQFF